MPKTCLGLAKTRKSSVCGERHVDDASSQHSLDSARGSVVDAEVEETGLGKLVTQESKTIGVCLSGSCRLGS